MERNYRYNNFNYLINISEYSKFFLFKLLIVFLYLISVNSFLNSRNKFLSFSGQNEILLKVKGIGAFPIISSSFYNRPSSYYLNNDPEEKTFINSDVYLPNSENDVKLIFTHMISNYNSMFQGCSNIIEIDLSNFTNSYINNIDNMFDGCSSLKSIKFGNFDISHITEMEKVFQNCFSLESLDLSSFKTSGLVHLHDMFYGCNSLKYLDMSNFDTSSNECSLNMFNGGCEKLEFINFKNAIISSYKLKQYHDMIASIVKNIILCVDEVHINILEQLIDINSCTARTTDCSNWKKYQKTIDLTSNSCIYDCSLTSLPYEYLGKCYEKCPAGTVGVNFKCYDCIELGKCPDMTATEYKNKIEGKITSYVNSSKVINGSNFLVAVISSDKINPEEQLKNGISAFDFGNCTNVLKEYYKIPAEENLIILNMEIKKEKNESDINDDKSFNLGKNTQLEIFDNSGKKLNLSICKENIKIFKYIGDVEELDINLAKSLSNQGIDIFNADDDFFNDICHNYNNSDDKDIILTDRRNDIYQNATFCQNGCVYKGMNYNLMAANCMCDSSFLEEDSDNLIFESSESNNFKEIKKIFLENLFSFNFDVLKCYNLVINKEIIVRNIGFYCLFLMFILQIIFFVIYLAKKLKSIKHFMLNKKSINNKNNIIINKNKNNIVDQTIMKNQIKSTPPHKNSIELKFKNFHKLNKGIKLNLSKSKINSSRNSFISHNLKNDIYIKNPIIFSKKNILIKENKKEKYNKSKGVKLIDIKNNNSIHNIKSDKRKFIQTYKNINISDKNNINNNEIEKMKFLQNINDIQNLDYEEAIFYDDRGYLKMYWGFLIDTQIILGTFCTDNHLDLFVIKLSFFIFTFQISFFLNALFYTDEYISNAYHNDGVLDIISGLPKSIYSYIATLITTNLLRILSNSKSELMRLIKENIKYKAYKSLIHIKLSKLRKKLIIYFILVFLFTLFFLYYVAAFCAVYRNSQKYWFFGCLESFGMDSLVSIGICIFLALFRYISIKKHIKCCYIISNIISSFM